MDPRILIYFLVFSFLSCGLCDKSINNQMYCPIYTIVCPVMFVYLMETYNLCLWKEGPGRGKKDFLL